MIFIMLVFLTQCSLSCLICTSSILIFFWFVMCCSHEYNEQKVKETSSIQLKALVRQTHTKYRYIHIITQKLLVPPNSRLFTKCSVQYLVCWGTWQEKYLITRIDENSNMQMHIMHRKTHQQLEDSNASRSELVSVLQISLLDERVALVHHFLSTPAQQCMQEHSYHA